MLAAMPQSLARILVHTVFSTKDRRPLLRDAALRQELHHYLGAFSSTWIARPSSSAAWKNGYGMSSIGASPIEDVRHYIAEQEQHHRKLSFQDEFRLLLKRYEIAYDERYVWD